MPSFRVSLEGSPITIDLDGERQRVGFMTARFVEAAADEEASVKAIRLVRSDPKLLRSTHQAEINAMNVIVEGVEEVPQGDVPPIQPGFAFFPLDDDEEVS